MERIQFPKYWSGALDMPGYPKHSLGVDRYDWATCGTAIQNQTGYPRESSLILDNLV